MMSAFVPVVIAPALANVHALKSDAVEIEGETFAESLKEHVNVSVKRVEETPLDESGAASTELKSAIGKGSLVEIEDAAAKAEGKGFATHVKAGVTSINPRSSNLESIAPKTLAPEGSESSKKEEDSQTREDDSSVATMPPAAGVSLSTSAGSTAKSSTASSSSQECNVEDELQTKRGDGVLQSPEGSPVAKGDSKVYPSKIKAKAQQQERINPGLAPKETVLHSLVVKPTQEPPSQGVVPQGTMAEGSVARHSVTEDSTPAVEATGDDVSDTGKSYSSMDGTPLFTGEDAGGFASSLHHVDQKANNDALDVPPTTAVAESTAENKTTAVKPATGLSGSFALATGSQGDTAVSGSLARLTDHGVEALPDASVVAPGVNHLGATKMPSDGISDSGSVPAAGARESEHLVSAAGSMEVMPRMLAATPKSLEVGLQGGTNGWLKVRAAMAEGGMVNASVSASSTAGQEMLHRELPSITAYLQSEKVAVNTVIVHTATNPHVGSRSSGAGATSGGGGESPHRGHEGGEQQQRFNAANLGGFHETRSYQGSERAGDDLASTPGIYGGGGSWLSVRA